MPHRARPFHEKGNPLHITMRLRADVPSLRGIDTFPVVREAIARSSRKGFAIVHFSAQSNHLHLFVEAASTKALSKGMQGLSIRIARAINKLHHRRGAVWADRYHAHELGGRMETRNALAYVLFNHQHHSPGANGIDRCSSGYWHADWHAAPKNVTPPVRPPQTWLARIGWRLTKKGRFLPSPYRY